MKKALSLIILFLSAPALCLAEMEISSVWLNSIQMTGKDGGRHLKFGFRSRKAGSFEPVLDRKKAVQKELEYFFIGLSLSESVFWVNLNPDKGQRMIDPLLGDTDLGRIMLAADLRLKKDFSSLLDPQSSTGREFWRRVYARAEEYAIKKITLDTTVRIVPGINLVSEQDDCFSIVSSRLKVSLKPELSLRPATSPSSLRGREAPEAISIAVFDLMQELLLPILENKVNEDFSYADLREVYNALLIAKWYKQKYSPAAEILQDAQLDYAFSPEQIHQEYLQVFQGEYRLTETNFFHAVKTERSYSTGGIEFQDITYRVVARRLQEDGALSMSDFTCDLFLPHNLDRPLQYAKSHLELESLSHSFPAIVAAQILNWLTALDRAERLLLNKL